MPGAVRRRVLPSARQLWAASLSNKPCRESRICARALLRAQLRDSCVCSRKRLTVCGLCRPWPFCAIPGALIFGLKTAQNIDFWQKTRCKTALFAVRNHPSGSAIWPISHCEMAHIAGWAGWGRRRSGPKRPEEDLLEHFGLSRFVTNGEAQRMSSFKLFATSVRVMFSWLFLFAGKRSVAGYVTNDGEETDRKEPRNEAKKRLFGKNLNKFNVRRAKIRKA